jgi:hypothetical protein
MYTVKTLNKIAKIGMDRLDKNYFIKTIVRKIRMQ